MDKLRAVMITGKKNAFFNTFVVEAPDGKKVYIHPVNAYAPDYRRNGVMAERRRDEIWYGQFVSLAEKLDLCGLFIDAEFKPHTFLEILKARGYKIHWVD